MNEAASNGAGPEVHSDSDASRRRSCRLNAGVGAAVMKVYRPEFIGDGADLPLAATHLEHAIIALRKISAAADATEANRLMFETAAEGVALASKALNAQPKLALDVEPAPWLDAVLGLGRQYELNQAGQEGVRLTRMYRSLSVYARAHGIDIPELSHRDAAEAETVALDGYSPLLPLGVLLLMVVLVASVLSRI